MSKRLLKGSFKCIKISILVLLSFLMIVLSGCDTPELFTSEQVLNGRIESTQVNITSEVSGNISELYKEEGSYIKKGEIIAQVQCSDKELELKQLEINIKIMEEKLKQLETGPSREEIKAAEALVEIAKSKLDDLKENPRQEKIKEAELTVELSKKKCDYAKQSLETAQNLYKEGTLALSGYLDAKQKYEESEINLKMAENELSTVKLGPTAEAFRSAEASYSQALAQMELQEKGPDSEEIEIAAFELEKAKIALEQAKQNLAKYTIQSPIGGIFIEKNVNIADMINTGTCIGKISDLSDLYAKVYIPQRYVGWISLGQEVNLESISLPGKTIKGKIVYIASQSEFLPQDIDKNEAEKSTVFEVKIKIVDNIKDLRPGMTIDAYIPKHK